MYLQTNFLIFLSLSDYSNEKVDLMNIAERDYPKEMEEFEELAAYPKKFLAFEISGESTDDMQKKLSKYSPF